MTDGQHPKIRADLRYRADPEVDGRFYIKDPIRGEFFRFNSLQVEMMEALDGKRSVHDVQQYLADKLDVEVPEQSIERFLVRLENLLLLDVTSYVIDDEKTRKAILAHLQKKNLHLRVLARDSLSPEGSMFEAATRQVNEGDPLLAARYFEAVLEINPANARAKEVLQAIQVAFFKTKIKTPSYVYMVHVLDPSRMLGWIDRKIGRFVFSLPGLVLMTLFILSSAWSIADVFERRDAIPSFGIVDAFGLFVVFAIQAFWHEMSHGWACTHYGGTVEDIGVALYYGVFPGAYCDVGEAYYFTDRRPKIVVQLAGVFGHMVLQAAGWHLLAFTDPSFPLWTALLAANLRFILSNIDNLSPLMKFDGYYALAEYLEIANLRETSFAYLKERLASWIFGVESSRPELPPRERRIYLIYGVAAAVYMAAFVYFTYILFLLPLLAEHFGQVGMVLSVYLFFTLVVKDALAGLLTFGRWMWKERRTIFTRKRSIVFATAFIATAILFAYPWPIYARGSMTVEPQQRAMIRAHEAGLLQQVLVHEGEQVKAGQILAVLVSNETVRDLAAATQQLEIAKARLSLLQRGARPEAIAVVRSNTRYEIARRNAATSNLASKQRARALQVGTAQSVVGAALTASEAGGEARIMFAQQRVVEAGARTEELAGAEASVRSYGAVVQDLQRRIAMLTLRSTIDGVVVTNHIEESIGKWIAAGSTVLEVQDTSQWRIKIALDHEEQLTALAVGKEVDLRADGAPHQAVHAQVKEILPPTESSLAMVLYAHASPQQDWYSGMTGVARVRMETRTVAYRFIAQPIRSIIGIDLWRLR